jgi:hypothetical protein
MPEDKVVDHIASIKKKFLSTSLEGISYKKKAAKQQWIIIHNMGGSDTAGACYNHFNNGSPIDGVKKYTSTQYAVDDKEVWQLLEDTWEARHAGGPVKGQYGADRGASNANSIGIEIADGAGCDKNKAVEIGIELARYLCQKHNIPTDNVIQHYDVSGKDCPLWIRANDKWDYIKAEIKRRNDEKLPIKFDTSYASTDNVLTTTAMNFDNRENWVNVEEVKGIILNFMPPYHFVSVENKDTGFREAEYNREFHYAVDSSIWKEEKEKTLVAFSMQDNNRHTYIERALYNNKAPKYTLSVGIFVSKLNTDYTVTEKLLIDNVARILHENNLNPNHLWREFDLNRAPSPLMYLDRIQWKKFLKEVDKLVEWRYANYGTIEAPVDNKIPKPEIIPTMTHEEYLKYIENADPKLIDIYAAAQEPYDKGLKEIIDAPITNDDRLANLTQTLITENEVTINYNVVESSPGGTDHCVKPTEELNALYKPDELKVEPIYPDLIIPPNYTSSDYNIATANRLPLTALEDMSMQDETIFDKQIGFDFDLLKEMNKKSKGKK